MEGEREERKEEEKKREKKCKCSYLYTAYNPNMYLFLIRSRR